MEKTLSTKAYGNVTFYFDEIDADWINSIPLKIRLNKNNMKMYVDTWKKVDGKFKNFSLSRLIMNAPPELQVDHKDGNSLNNRRNNLRLATATQNNINRINKSNTSGFRGVWRSTNGKKWRVAIRGNGKKIQGGVFENKIEAALKYNEMAKKYHGDFAILNEIPKHPSGEVHD